MKYYRISLYNINDENDSDNIIYFENKTEIGTKKIASILVERGEISPFDVGNLIIKEINEEEYEENCF